MQNIKSAYNKSVDAVGGESMNQKTMNIDFVGYSRVTALFSLGILAFFVGMSIYRYTVRSEVFSYSIDFTGGTQVLLKFSNPVSAQDIRSIVEKNGWQNPVLREFSAQEILVRVKEFSNDAKGLSERIRKAIIDAHPDYSVEILQSEGVGPGVGQTLRWRALLAVLVTLIALLIYIAARFWSVAFAVGAVLALFHDAIVMLATVLLFDLDISINVIVAILAVLGYSINDTIVIFTQIRNNFRTMTSNDSIARVVNVSINHMFRRSILTSFSTALTVASMLLLGGEALHDFSLILLIGIIFGTYSSIYIASPVMMALYKRE